MASKTNPRQRAAVLALLADHPTWSNKDIANQVPGVSAQAVAMFRSGKRPPTHSVAAPRVSIDPLPDPSISLDNLADLDEPPAPPPGMEYQPTPEVPERPTLNSGTKSLIDVIVPNLALITVAIALRAAPERVQPFIPSPQVGELILAAPLRIVARHSHIKVDEMSEDGKDLVALSMAFGAWGMEIRENLKARADWHALQQQNGATNGQRAYATGYSTPSAGVSDAGGYAAPSQPAGGAWAGLAGAGAMAAEKPSGNGHARSGGGSVEPDTATGRQLMAGLYQSDAIGRRQRGLQ